MSRSAQGIRFKHLSMVDSYTWLRSKKECLKKPNQMMLQKENINHDHFDLMNILIDLFN